jgi:endonuclease YncB( thermonuclease family)
MPQCRRIRPFRSSAMSAHAPRRRAGIARWTILIPFTFAVPAVAPAWGEGTPACRFETIGAAAVAHVRDGRTFVLADGRAVRLVGIEVPALPEPETARVALAAQPAGRDEDSVSDIGQPPDDTAASPAPPAAPPAPAVSAGQQAKAALESLLAGGEVVLKRLGPAADRYGRVAAHAFVFSEAGERWIEAELVAAGFARVSPRLERGCAKELIARERAARAAKLGLWAEPVYETARAEDHAAVGARRGQFTLVEGKVLSVRESGGTIYVNFGRRWSEDFTVTIAKRNERAFTAAGLEPKKLQGRLVRIRGWIEERGGPWIDAARPEQIEVVEK